MERRREKELDPHVVYAATRWQSGGGWKFGWPYLWIHWFAISLNTSLNLATLNLCCYI
jgi:hypothetical protein